MRNFYSVLNLDNSATQDDIKKAFRKLAFLYHPDKAGEQSKELFQSINEAYTVLSNISAKKEYDILLEKYRNKNKTTTTITPNKDIHATLEISMKESIDGIDKLFLYTKNNTENTYINVNCGPKIVNGFKIRYVGYGDSSNRNIKAGDLILTLKIKEDSKFKIKNDNDILTTIKIDYITASIGGEKYIDNFDESIIKFDIPESCLDGDIISINNCGLYDKFNNRGKIYGIIKLVPPKLSKNKKQALKYINNYVDPEEMVYQICSSKNEEKLKTIVN